MKNKPLSPKEIHSLKTGSVTDLNRKINELIHLGQESTIRFLLKRELAFHDLPFCSTEELKHQLLLARTLSQDGALHFSKRICRNVFNEVLKRISTLSSEEIYALFYLCSIPFTLSYDIESISQLAQILEKQPNLRTHPKKSFFDLIYFQTRIYAGEIQFDEVAQLEFEQIRTQALQDPNLKCAADFYYLQNLFWFQLADPSNIRKELLILKEKAPFSLQAPIEQLIFKTNYPNDLTWLSRPDDEIAFYCLEKRYFQLFCQPNKLNISDLIFLKCYPLFNEYSYLVGNEYIGKIPILPDSFIRHLSFMGSTLDLRNQDPYWLISSNSIEAISDYALPRDQVLNLISGIFIRNSQMNLLSEKRAKVLLTIISCGSFGATDNLLIESLFPNELADYSYLIPRIQDIITQLQKNGFPVLRKNKKIYFDFQTNDLKIVFSKNRDFKGLPDWLKLTLPEFNRKLLSDTFHITERTANHWIKSWKVNRKIVESPHQKGFYQIEN